MRKIHVKDITYHVERLCIEANYNLPKDIREAIQKAREVEESDVGKMVLDCMMQNEEIASQKQMAICQDTGMVVAKIDIGQDVHVIGGDITEAINEGVRNGYKKGYLRNSVVNDPLIRINTGDNTPAVIHYNIVPGDTLKITIAPKGFGSENMSSVKMLKPSDGEDGVKDFIIETVSKAGPNPCPPIIVGVGIGGTMEKAAQMAKFALMRPVEKRSDIEHIKNLEEELMVKINELGIGPSGLGGTTTVLGVNILTFPTHIAGLPVAVNIGCHVTRHKEVII